MKRLTLIAVSLLTCLSLSAKKQKTVQPTWPNGEVMDEWFTKSDRYALEDLGKQYKLTDYHINADGRVHTA